MNPPKAEPSAVAMAQWIQCAIARTFTLDLNVQIVTACRILVDTGCAMVVEQSGKAGPIDTMLRLSQPFFAGVWSMWLHPQPVRPIIKSGQRTLRIFRIRLATN